MVTFASQRHEEQRNFAALLRQKAYEYAEHSPPSLDFTLFGEHFAVLAQHVSRLIPHLLSFLIGENGMHIWQCARRGVEEYERSAEDVSRILGWEYLTPSASAADHRDEALAEIFLVRALISASIFSNTREEAAWIMWLMAAIMDLRNLDAPDKAFVARYDDQMASRSLILFGGPADETLPEAEVARRWEIIHTARDRYMIPMITAS